MSDQSNTVVLSDSTLGLVNELRSIREDVKALKAREEKIRDLLLTELKGADGGVTASGEFIISIDRSPRSGINRDRLQALYPDVYRDCQTETQVQAVRFPETV